MHGSCKTASRLSMGALPRCQSPAPGERLGTREDATELHDRFLGGAVPSIAFTTVANASIVRAETKETSAATVVTCHCARGSVAAELVRKQRRSEMEFGYFTLSDNHYENNPRTANRFVADIAEEALYADKLGMHSAWIGEHHFNSLGVLSCPDLVLAYIAARTTHIRLAPAVTVLPLHHPIRVAEQWASLDLLSGGRVDFAAGRGYDAREYLPFKVSFADNQSIFDEGLEIVRKLWAAEGRI